MQINAERLLLKAALLDSEFNERFLLLSESCVPLYSPSVIWTSMMKEPRSRINACADNSKEDKLRRMTHRRAWPSA